MKNLFLLFVLISFSSMACKPRPVGGKLGNTLWSLAAAKSGKTAVAPTQGVEITAVFGNTKVGGDAACNSYRANIEIKGTAITVSDLQSTERMCDEIDQENSYLGMLTKAQSFSVLKDKLEIYCENGTLVFVPMSEKERAKYSKSGQMRKLDLVFPHLEGNPSPHLYPILRVDHPGEYPYLGVLIDTSFYRLFDDESHSIWSNTGGDVYAVGKFGDFYVCRVPGRYVSSDMAIFALRDGSLHRSETVAWAWCDEGWCNQQDAWLIDMNQDGHTDVVQHYTLRDDKGKLREERMTVLLQNQMGTFEVNKGIKADKSKFAMAKL